MNIKTSYLIAWLCLASFYLPYAQLQTNNTLSFEVYKPAKQNAPIKSLLLAIGDNKLLRKIAKIIKVDLEFSDQINVELKQALKELKPELHTKFYKKGTSLCIYLKANAAENNDSTINVHVAIKDLSTLDTLFDKGFSCNKKSHIKEAHSVSQQLLTTLTGDGGPSLSTLAYCKQLAPNHKVICLSDYACKKEKKIVAARTINVAPCWHNDTLFYSQFTRANSRLMAVNIGTKKHKVICSYDGLNMQPTFSPDGKKTVLCLSGKGNSELYLYDQELCRKHKQRAFKQLTFNKGNNASPNYLPNGDIVFCSDFQTGQPQIYRLNHLTHETICLTNGRGYCAAPSYCTNNGMVAYIRFVNGTFQLFSLNVHDEIVRERQLTFSPGDKVDPSWSECGRYLAFITARRQGETNKLVNQIAVLNIASGQIKILTHDIYHKSFPVWTKKTLYVD